MTEGVEQPKQEKKPFLSEGTKKILKGIYLVIMIGYSIYSVYIAISAYTKFSSITGQFLGLLGNWKQNMIRDVVTVSNTADCPTGFTPLFNYKWPGTIDGCNCKSINNTLDASSKIILKREIYREKCNTTQTGLGCALIAQTPEKNLSIYRGSKYCVERIAGTSFLDAAKKMKEDGTCMDGYIKCGGKDASLNAICADKSKFNNVCPVMDITDSPPATNGYLRVGTSNLYITRFGDFGNSSISEIYANDGGICLGADNAKLTTTTLPNHVLMRTNFKVCNDFDSSYKTFGQSVPLKDFFTANGVMVSLVQDLDQNITNSQNLIPFKKDYTGFKPSCRDEVQPMVDSEDEVKSIRGAQTGLLAIAIIVGFLLGVVYIILELIVMFGCGCSEEKQEKLKNCLECRIWVNPILKILHIIILAWAVSVSGRVRGYFTNLADQNCGSDSTNKNLIDLSDQVNRFVYQKNRDSLIVTCVMLLIDIITLCYKKCCEKKKNLEAVQPKIGS